ncbi:MAG: FAD-dependent oxidoreductase [Chloroflexota bacterium]
MTLSVLVLGAGFGGLELSSHLARTLGDAVDITLIDRSDSFTFGFAKIDLMLGRSEPDAVRLPYAGIAHPQVHFRQETITAIDPVARTATTERATYGADVLVVALGAAYDLDATPGLREAGHEFYSPAGALELREVLAGFAGGAVVVGVCGTPFKCPPAPSEAAFLLDDLLRRRGTRDASTITVVLPMAAPVPPSPATSSAILARFEERGIRPVLGRHVASLDPATREAVLDDGARHPFDLFLGVPVHRVPAVVEAAGLAENGWVPVDRRTLATRFPGVYAVGDVTSVGTSKAGVFAERAARAVADGIIARVRGEAEPAGYDGTGSCWLEMGAGEVARVDVDFYTTPGTPIGRHTDPDDETRTEKSRFAASRRERWFGTPSA